METKIVFICGSLEIGRNGVGDYARLLAGEIIRAGYPSAIIAINDENVTEKLVGAQFSNDIEIPVLRLPAILPAPARFDEARKWLVELNPEWISLQFVTYAYNSKGLPFDLGRKLVDFGVGYKWHIMFHELWIGIEPDKYLRTAIISNLQRFIITKRILKPLKPHVIHTHLPEFRAAINAYGWDVKSLPLFSNINVASTPKGLFEQGVFRIGFFNQAEASPAIITFLTEIEKQVFAKGLKLEIIFVGGAVKKMKEVGDHLESLNIFEAPVNYTGFLQSDELSIALQSCSLGVTPVPRHALGKSGSVAAFLLHDVPVAAPNIHPKFKLDEIGFHSALLCSSIVLEPDIDMVADLKKIIAKAKLEIQLPIVAAKFLSDLI